jgi:hypothetical protein
VFPTITVVTKSSKLHLQRKHTTRQINVASAAPEASSCELQCLTGVVPPAVHAVIQAAAPLNEYASGAFSKSRRLPKNLEFGGTTEQPAAGRDQPMTGIGLNRKIPVVICWRNQPETFNHAAICKHHRP